MASPKLASDGYEISKQMKVGFWRFVCDDCLRRVCVFLFSSRPRAEQSLVRWATPQLHDIDALAKMVDPSLKGIYPAKSLSRFADIIALCVQPEPEFRPPMSELVQALVRLMQRASLSKRRSGDDRSLDHHDTTDISG
jgi:hypothetical protein